MTKFIIFLTTFLFLHFKALALESKGVITTIQPINSMVSAVIGNTGKTISLIPAEISPHEFKLKPSDAKKMQEGNVIFYISKHLESDVVKVFDNLPKNIKIVDLLEETGIEHLSIRDNEAWERHDHHGHDDHDDHDKHSKKHDDHDKHCKKHDDHDHDKHAKNHDDHDDHQTKDDVHIWLSPDNAIKIINKANKVLSLYYPQNAKIYDENTKIMIDKINKLKAELTKDLAPIKDKPYVVIHDAYQYFEKAFGLNAVGSVALEGDIASSPKQVSYIKEKIVKLKASCVFQVLVSKMKKIFIYNY